MAGGDGSQALVASIAVECGIPFVCVTAGTRNHFAQDLGLDRDDPRGSVHAFRDAVERRIDYATVNDRFFVNNVSLGRLRDDRPAGRLPRREGRDDQDACCPELLGNTDAPFDLQFTTADGTEIDGAFVIQVSNNPYALGSSLDVGQRRRIDTASLVSSPLTGATGKDAAAVIAARRRRSTEPQPELARVHRRDALRFGRDRALPLPVSTARHSRWPRRWCSGSTPAGSVCWCPKETSKQRSGVAPATSASGICSMSPWGERDAWDVPAKVTPVVVMTARRWEDFATLGLTGIRELGATSVSPGDRRPGAPVGALSLGQLAELIA